MASTLFERLADRVTSAAKAREKPRELAARLEDMKKRYQEGLRLSATVATNKKEKELERLARIKERRRLLRARLARIKKEEELQSSLNVAMPQPSSTDTTTTTPSVPADNNHDSILFNFDAEKASSVSAKTISKGVWESLLSGGTTSPRGDIGDSGTFEHPEGRPDLRRGGLTNNKKKKRSDARTNRIVAEYSKIKKSKKKVATNNGKKRTK
tara:strand:+ start:232 stop:867 length:636 start_codon:yes stop_codon:yes gene_type:complete